MSTKQNRPKPTVRTRAEILQVRLTPAEKTAFVRAAEVSGIELSAWVRERLRTLAARELQAVGEQASFLEKKQ